MKTSKKIMLASIAALTLTASSFAAFAYQGNPAVQGPNYTPERHAEMTKAFEAQNFEAWSTLMAERNVRVKELVNKDNFAEFKKAHDLALKGNLDGAKAIRAELGLGLRDGSMQGSRRRNGQGMHKGQGRMQNKDCDLTGGMRVRNNQK